eukprot:Rhum_TRINITY_DN3172_c0_g1::Rhum_TRINITY_DN3172_c0_g1_i1::g.9880::m.9880
MRSDGSTRAATNRSPSRRRADKPTNWLVRDVPGTLSVREAAAALGDAVTVVDRMLGLHMLAVRVRGRAPPALPAEWGARVVLYTSSPPEESGGKPRRDTDVVIVHCLTRGELSRDKALRSLILMKFPLAHVRCVFLGRGAKTRGEKTGGEGGGEKLHEIYVQMESVEHARALVPDRVPLQPLFDAVACKETGCVLHVLQRSPVEHDERRSAVVYRMSKKTLRRWRVPPSLPPCGGDEDSRRRE